MTNQLIEPQVLSENEISAKIAEIDLRIALVQANTLAQFNNGMKLLQEEYVIWKDLRDDELMNLCIEKTKALRIKIQAVERRIAALQTSKALILNPPASDQQSNTTQQLIKEVNNVDE